MPRLDLGEEDWDTDWVDSDLGQTCSSRAWVLVWVWTGHGLNTGSTRLGFNIMSGLGLNMGLFSFMWEGVIPRLTWFLKQ